MTTRFVAKWGDAVREKVEAAALDPARLTAKAIHAGLVAGATGQGGALSPSDIPPEATVAKWVSEVRRDARDALTGSPEALTKMAHDLTKKLRARVANATTPNEIAACAKAARELAALDRDLNARAQASGSRSARSAPRSSQADTETGDDGSADDAELEFLRGLDEPPDATDETTDRPTEKRRRAASA